RLDLLRDLVCYDGRHFTVPRVRVEQARALLDLLVESVADPDGAYARILKEEAAQLRDSGDSYLLHEHLEEVNQPLYFYQFAERFAAKGLRYMREARFSPMASRIRPEATDKLCRLAADEIQCEQYLDFLRNRTFRRSLLCHNQV